MAGVEAFKDGAVASLDTPTPVPSQDSQVGVDRFSEDDGIITGEAGLTEKTNRIHWVSAVFWTLACNPFAVKRSDRHPKQSIKKGYLSFKRFFGLVL